MMSYRCINRLVRTFTLKQRIALIKIFDINHLNKIRTFSGSVVYSSKVSSTAEIPVKPPDNSDVFGTLKEPLEKSLLINSHTSPVKGQFTEDFNQEKDEQFSADELHEESDDELYEENDGEQYSIDRKSAQYYVTQMKRLCREKKLKEALELYSEMKRERVYPKKFIYTYLIGACGRAGYTKMAFKLFKQMRDRGIKPSPATLTGLFNSCAESPFPEHALEKAHYLREKVIENSWVPSTITYHSMIKAFGKCGDLKTAFLITDEMKREGHSLTDETFSFLLMSCISDKEAGFTHAVQVFRKMRKFRIQPTKYIYNLLLRAVRDCGIGTPEIAMNLLLDWTPSKSRIRHLDKPNPENRFLAKQTHNTAGISDSCNNLDVIERGKDISSELELKKLNLLVPIPTSSHNILGLENVQLPQDRLLIIGGIEGILSSMINYNITPDKKTISILLDCIPSTPEAEGSLLSAVEKYEIKPDIDFFNLLIKRRNFRGDYRGALELLNIIQKFNLKVNIVTYGVLALGCKKRFQANKLINDMKEASIQPSIEIMGALVKTAVYIKDYEYILDVMRAVKEFNVKPDHKFLDNLEKARKSADEIQLKNTKDEYVNEYQLKWCKIFCLHYKPWLMSIGVEIQQHPWDQYRVKI